MPENFDSSASLPVPLPDPKRDYRDGVGPRLGPPAIPSSSLFSSQPDMAPSERGIASLENSISEETARKTGAEETLQLSLHGSGEQLQPANENRLPLKESLGWTGSVTVFGGSAVLLLSTGFLSLLWFGYGDEPEAVSAPWVWRRIALNDWMTRAITISALVLRSVVSFQVALCTSMTAALILEKRSARKSDVAYLSIARSVSDGPRKVVQLLLSSRSWFVLTYIELWLICLLALVSLTLQFSSTFLLSDLHDFVIAGDVKSKPVVNFGTFDILNDTGVQTPSLENDPVYAVFGEERANPSITPSASGFSDTGIIRRGFLPFQGSEERTSVRKFRGSTIVANSRTVCVPPQLKGHFLSPNGELEYAGVGHMVGTLDYSRSIQQAHGGLGPLCVDRECEPVPFDCSIPGLLYDNLPQSNFCFIETIGRTARDIAALLPYNLLTFLTTEADPWALNSTMFLVSRSKVTANDWNGIVDKSPMSMARTVGEWNRFDIVDGRSVDISLCFARFYLQPQYVDMVAEKPTREPILEWDGISPNHDSTAAAASVSVETPLKRPSDRGLMDMNILTTLDPDVTENKTRDGLTYPELSAVVLGTTLLAATTSNLIPGSILGCIFCADFSFTASQEFCLLFTDIIESTGRAAPAVHTYFAVSALESYNTYLKGFNITESVELTTTASVRTPGPCSEYKCSGFISVIVLLGAHLVLVIVITALFVAQARYSRCSNTWHAVAQLFASEELQDILYQSNNAKDTQITESLARDGKDDFVTLGLISDSDRVQIFKQASQQGKSSLRP